jgi:hypothetical protein
MHARARRLVEGLVTVLFALIPAPAHADGGASDAPAYSIVLDRPLTVGQRLHVKAEGSQDVRSTPIFMGQRRDVQRSVTWIELEAEAEVLAVDDKGRPTKIDYTIEKCERTFNDIKRVVAKKGMSLVAERRGDETFFTVDGRELGGQATDALRIVARFEDDGITLGELAGSATPRRPGETWSIDVEATLAALRERGGEDLTTDHISGEVELGGVMDYTGHSCLLVETRIEILDWLSEITPGFDLREAKLGGVIQAVLPEDETLPALAESQRVEISAYLVSEPGQPDIKFDFQVTQRLERDVRPVATPHPVAAADPTADRPE